MDYAWLYVDLNAYFASVEQELCHDLRGKPIAVVPLLSDRTCCISASYEARAYGIKTGTIISEAKRLCPSLILVKAEHERYVSYHQHIVDAVERCLPVDSVCSIDEVACRLSGSQLSHDNALKLANDVRHSIYKVGAQLSCSIGIAPSKYLAKVAADMKKPNGFTLLKKDELFEKLSCLKLNDLPGVGKHMEKRIRARGIVNMKQLLSLPQDYMRSLWGSIWGDRMFLWLRGEDIELTHETHKSMGHQHVLAPHLRNWPDARSVLFKLLIKASKRIRHHNLWTRGLFISVRCTNQLKYRRDCRIDDTQDIFALSRHLQKLWESIPQGADVPFKVTAILAPLVTDQHYRIPLFAEPRWNKASHAMDQINKKFGKNTLYPASLHEFEEAAPTHIAFSSIPDFSI